MTAIPWKLVSVGLAAGLLIALGVIATLASARNEARRERDGALQQAAVLMVDLSTCRANGARLETALQDQGRTITEMGERSAEQQAEGAANLAAVEAQNADLLASIRILREKLRQADPQSCDEGWNAFTDAVRR